MKIIIVAPKSISSNPFRYDYAFWNFYFPMLSLGHDARFFDTSRLGDDELQKEIESFKPDLLFCIMTGDASYCPREPWQTIASETQKGRLKTFNWFCDDTWRFDSFSKKVCNNFHICSTPEKKFVEEYKKLQYDNIIYATWHANSDFYSNLCTKRDNLISFVGAPRGDRGTFLRALEEGGISVTHPMNASFEDLIFAYSNSQMGINFSKNSNNNKTQMKARMFEIPAAGSLLVTEYHENLSECYEIDKEIVTFGSSVEMIEKINFLSKNPKIVDNIRNRGHKRFLKEHDSKVRLNMVLNRIKEL